jgi:hypothetical protein
VEEKSIQVVADVKAAKLLDIGVQTLRNWRHMRKGPTYLKIGRSVRYRLDDLNKFMENNRIDPDNQK